MTVSGLRKLQAAERVGQSGLKRAKTDLVVVDHERERFGRAVGCGDVKGRLEADVQ